MSVPSSSLRFHLLLWHNTALHSNSILASGLIVTLTATRAFSLILSLTSWPLTNTYEGWFGLFQVGLHEILSQCIAYSRWWSTPPVWKSREKHQQQCTAVDVEYFSILKTVHLRYIYNIFIALPCCQTAFTDGKMQLFEANTANSETTELQRWNQSSVQWYFVSWVFYKDSLDSPEWHYFRWVALSGSCHPRTI